MTKRRQTSTTPLPVAPNRTVDLFLWDAPSLMTQTGIWVSQAPGISAFTQSALKRTCIDLNDPQWIAWGQALERRLTLIWGPPGTGKTVTLRALAAGLCVAAAHLGTPLRLLISASNYNAFDNVIKDVESWQRAVDALGLPQPVPVRLHRLRGGSDGRLFPDVLKALPIIDTSTSNDVSLRQLRRDLESPQGIMIVAATPGQIYNLTTKTAAASESPVAALFTYVLVDEASQMDVGHILPLLCAATDDAQIALAGDPMQLPPIHKSPAPKGAEYMLGSVYDYVRTRFDPLPAGVEQMLEINYRSNEEIVAYGQALGYGTRYQSKSRALRLLLNMPIGAYATKTPPTGWPASLAWSPVLARIVDPDVPVVCISYSEGRSGQSNRFESQVVASLLRLLWDASPRQQLANEVGVRTPLIGTHTFETFWRCGVGVVTPHSAQRTQIVGELRRAFGGTFQQGTVMREAVDTVEKLQGQQRDVIVASFAIGDPDVVAAEEEFLFMLTRFNVMASRARAKLIVIVTDEVLDYISDDSVVLEGSRAIKLFARTFCRNPRPLRIPWIDRAGVTRDVAVELRTVP